MTTLLTAAQKKTCQSHEHDPAPNGPRANALLALNNGKTQQQAADDSGLSIGQVRYCLRRFRTVSLAIFETEKAAPVASSPSDNETVSSAKEKKKSHKKIKKLKPIKSQKNDSEKKTKKKKNDKKIKKKKSDKKDDGKKSSKSSKNKKKK